MNWKNVRAVPRWNPYKFEVCRHLNGMGKGEFAGKVGKVGMSARRYSAIENGEIVPTDEEVRGICEAQTHVLIGFFEQWPLTTLDFSGPFVRTVPIDYYRYKVFRELNPPQMVVV